MEREITEVYCGNGKGKTTLAVGRGLRFATQGKSVIIIQFLKGRERRELDFLEELDNFDFKIFRFEKMDTWKLMDPTFDANSDGDEAIQEYIGDESNYTVQFTR